MSSELTPRQIVAELDRYIIGQEAAKKCVAIAIRNRWRRLQLEPHLREEILPKNIIMIGPTGVGKTEIARRLAQLIKAPFLKVEATKYTEVGYHGRDVDSMIRDLVEVSVNMVRQQAIKEVEQKAQHLAEERLLKILLPTIARHHGTDEESTSDSSREKLREKLNTGALDNKLVELQVEERIFPMMQVFSSSGFEEYGLDIQTVLGDLFPAKKVTRKVTVKEAYRILVRQEAEKLIDKEKLIKEGIQRAENSGIIFVDEIDKIATSYKISSGPDVSREGVQRDLLPIVEGTTVPSRYGPINTQHILFISAGAFNISKPSDLIPELQGRFPLRVELTSLEKADFVRILTEPENALIKQYQALLSTEGITIKVTKDAIDEMAEIAAQVNATMQNIGARRLHTVVEKVLEDISFEAPEISKKTITITRSYVKEKLKTILEQENLKRYIL